jgi:competence protein ComEC
VPLITLAYFAIAAGLLLGFGGFVFLAVSVALVGLVLGAVRRSTAGSALSALLAAGALLSQAVRRADAECARAIVARGRAVVRLGEDLSPRNVARGIVVGGACGIRARIRADSGWAAAGSVVTVSGQARRDGELVTFARATVRSIEPASAVARARSRAGRLIDELYGANAPLARALLIADERDIAPDVRRQFADAGIIHMLSVSGLHVAVLAEAVALTLLIAGTGVARAELVAVLVTAAFVLFVGAPAPALRAGSMYSAVVVSRRLQRPTSPWAFLALGGVLPLVDPRVVCDVGYQLSVAGMAGLIASRQLWRRLPTGHLPPWGTRLASEGVATVIACAVTAPIVAWQFGRVSLAAPVTNLVAAPLFGLAQPALFLSVVIAPWHPLARFIADGTSLLLSAIGGVAAIGASIPGAALDVIPSAATGWLTAFAAVALVALCASRHWIRPALAGVGAVTAALWWPVVAPASGRLELHVLDVGQGDAIALRTPSGHWVVIDAGNSWRGGDDGARLVAPYIRRRGGDVSALILSHPHSDHIGGAASLLRLVRVGAVYDGGVAYPSEEYDALLTSERVARVPWRLAREGETLIIDDVRLTMLGPDSTTAANARDPNDASVVVLVEYRGSRLLLTGDAERDEEARMVARFGDRLRAQVLKVGHHGSNTSSSAAFLDAVQPEVALVSVGKGNTYGHPSPDVMQSYERRRVQLLRTDDAGTIVVSTDGRTLWIRTDAESWTRPLAGAP